MVNNYLSRILTLVFVCIGLVGLTAQSSIDVNSPAGIAGNYETADALFSAGGTVTADLTLVDDGETVTTDACEPLINDLTGTIALITRGGCAFGPKAINAQNAGAVGAIVCNNSTANPAPLFDMVDGALNDITIPVVMLDSTSCVGVLTEIANGAVNVTINESVAGTSCVTAIDAMVGTNTAPGPSAGNAAIFNGAQNANFFRFEAPAGGLYEITSCASGVATRVVTVQADDCVELTNQIFNLSAFDFSGSCDDGMGGAVAGSELSDYMDAGEVKYIYWDDAGSQDGFDFEINVLDTPIVMITFAVDMLVTGADASGVFLAGNFNGWDAFSNPMEDPDGDNIWTTTIPLMAGVNYEYKFVNGDPSTGFENLEAGSSCTITTPDGQFTNRLLPLADVSSDAPIELGVVCFGSCGPCSATDCDNPIVLIEDDIDGLALGESVGQEDYFQFWPGASVGAQIVENPIGDGQAVLTDGTIAGQDGVLQFGDFASGNYYIVFDIYVPEGKNGYWNLQSGPIGDFFIHQLFLDDGGTGVLDLYAPFEDVEFEWDQASGDYLQVSYNVNLDDDVISLSIGGNFIYQWQPSVNNTGTANTGLTGLNLYPIDPSYEYYIDNINFWILPDAGMGAYCHTAEVITDPGTYTTADISCYGGMDQVDAPRGYWYEWTATEDGVLSVSTCGEGADTRVWIIEGGCENRFIDGINDDICELEPGGNLWASYKESMVTAGETYHILLDNRWDPAPWTVTIDFVAGMGGESLFCETAEVVTPGTYDLGDTFGNAAAGGLIEASSAAGAPGLYSTSNWFSWTPAEDTDATITSCDLAGGADTRVIVYTGTCGNWTTLEVAADSDDACGLESEINWPAVAGTTYYIEWLTDGVYTTNNHEWMLMVQEPTNEVTFTVDMSLEAANGNAADSIFVIGDFVGWDSNNAVYLEPQGNDVHSATVQIPVSIDTVVYKFQNGRGNFEPGDNLNEDCGIQGGFGFDRLGVIDGDTDLGEFCYTYCYTCQQVVDTDDPAFIEGISLRPNPTTGFTQLFFDFDQARNLNIRVMNQLGQQINVQNLRSATVGTVDLDLTNYAAGVYFVTITDGTNVKTERVMKQ